MTVPMLHDLLDHPELDRLVSGYFAQTDHGPRFTGSRFETLGGAGDAPEIANRFTAADLMAVTALSVKVTARAAVWIVEDGAAQLTKWLSAIPTDLEPGSAEGRELLTTPDSPVHRLFGDLKALDKVGWVTSGKLCARKRPHLVPVYDKHVRTAVGAPASWWTLVADAFDDPSFLAKLDQLRGLPAVPEHVSRLRVLDVAIWMQRHGHQWLLTPDLTGPSRPLI